MAYMKQSNPKSNFTHMLLFNKEIVENKKKPRPKDSFKKIEGEVYTIKVHISAVQNWDNLATSLCYKVEAVLLDGRSKTLNHKYTSYLNKPKTMAMLQFLNSFFFKRYRRRKYPLPKTSVEIHVDDIGAYLMLIKLMPTLRTNMEYCWFVENLYHEMKVPILIILSNGDKQREMVRKNLYVFRDLMKNHATLEYLGLEKLEYYNESLLMRDKSGINKVEADYYAQR